MLDSSTLTTASALALEYTAVPDDQRAAGQPTTGYATLGEFNGSEIGVWEMTPGAMTDVEADEVFIVLSGAASVDFTGTTESITLAPGDVGRLRAGQQTLWTVTETLRKVYVTPAG
ncbi:cupin domain-containing protein [Leifsonia sp. A12D58]|uniref:cupin domain-containing protein n=1 Tax=Leifsonia sp. A12D58 TaxID=3397674 RepID=UPI0039DFA261